MFSPMAPLLHKLLEVTLKDVDDDSYLLKRIKKSISNDLQSRYDSDDIKKHLRIAAFLYPRFKDLSPIVPALEHGHVYENAKAELLSLAEGVSDDEPAEPNPEPPRRKKSKLLDFFLDVYQSESKRKNNKLERVTAEVSRYKSEATIHIDEKPLLWWKA